VRGKQGVHALEQRKCFPGAFIAHVGPPLFMRCARLGQQGGDSHARPLHHQFDGVGLGNCVTVGHGAIVHACKVGDEVLVDMGAVILDGAVVGEQSIIGAKALVTQGMKIPAGSLVFGAPAKIVRPLTPKERAGLKWWAQKYVENSAYCLKHRINLGAPLPT
jgi:carbonic anhydrase/acetyltransferase-like protein (isoleucine patch superfamily)